MGDLIGCLICGREFKNLGIHVARTHGVGVRDYLQRFRLPCGFKMACEGSRQKYRMSALASGQPEKLRTYTHLPLSREQIAKREEGLKKRPKSTKQALSYPLKNAEVRARAIETRRRSLIANGIQ